MTPAEKADLYRQLDAALTRAEALSRAIVAHAKHKHAQDGWEDR